MTKVTVRPVIILSISSLTIPPDSIVGRFATEILEQAVSKGYTHFNPEMECIPLSDLMDRIEIVARYLLFEAAYWEDFEISGGFEIILPDDQRVGVTHGSSFRDAVGLARAVSSLTPDHTSQAFIENDRYFDLMLEDDTIKIIRGHTSRGVDPVALYMPAQELQEGVAEALSQLRQFAAAVEPWLVGSPEYDVPASLVRWMFGVE